MALFLEVHEFNGGDAARFARTRVSRAGEEVRLLRYWLRHDGGKIGLLLDAPAEEILTGPGAGQCCELFAPAERWLSHDEIDLS